MRHVEAKVAIVLSTLFAAGCRGPEHNLAKLTDEFVYTTLSFSPIAATAAGLHEYQGAKFDEQLDDMSPSAIDHRRQFYQKFLLRLNQIKTADLSPESRADYGILQDQIALALLDYEEIQSHLHNPTTYVEMVGNALFAPIQLDYAPLPTRIGHIIARLQKLPLFLDQARSNLATSPALWTKVAAEENEGNIELLDKTIRATVPADQRADFDRAATPALAALHTFQDFLQKSLSARDNYDWRLGRELYTRKFRYTLESGSDPTDVLESAARDMQDVRAKMMKFALALHGWHFPQHKDHSELPEHDRQNLVISEVLGRIAESHPTRETYIDEAKHDLEQARLFVQEEKLLTLPPRANLQVIPTPEFMRGSYPVGGFNPAPALEPKLGAFYWITPIPADWPAERVDSKLREYNKYKLKLLTIHEAMPGHYVQFEYANDVQPPSRRLLRGIYGNGPYIEGWAQYATQQMLDAGLLDNSAELRLTFQKEELRVIANAILDIRLQMLNMSDQEALDLMEKETFQETEEATAKLQRAKLTSAQLPTYFVGWRGWLKVRDAYQKATGGFKPATFHDAALREGAVPLPELSKLVTAQMKAGK